jgi:3-oxoacyl-(acyl-carrier-protein) synthase
VNYITTWCRIKAGNVSIDGKIFFSASIPFNDFMEKLYQHISPDYPKFFKMDRQCKLGFLACELLLKDKNLAQTNPYDTSVVLSNSNASLDTDQKYFESAKQIASPSLFVYTLPNIVNGELSIRHGLKGESNFFVTPGFDADIVCLNCDEILKEKSKICIAGWVDVMEYNYNAFIYLVEKKQQGIALAHTPVNLMNLYNDEYGTING